MVSVIVPVYNVAPYLSACLQSIAAQTERDLEVILVNDGSTDASGKICEEWIKMDSRFKVLHQENQGPSVARNIAIENAKGDFYVFVDSDDLLHPKMIETMLGHIGNNDIAACNMLEGEDCKWPEESQWEAKAYDSQQAIEMMLYQKQFNCSASGKLFRNTVFSYLRYRPGTTYEDLDLTYKLFAQATGSIILTNQPLYFYRKRKGSILHTYSKSRLDVLDVVEGIEQYYSQHPKLSAAARDRRFAANYNIFGISSYCDVPAEVAEQCWEQVKRLRGEILRNPKSRLKNKLGALVSYLGPNVTSKITKIIYQ